MNQISDKEIAEFIKLFQNAQAPKEEAPTEPEGRPFMFSDANDAAKQLGDYLRKLHAEDMQNHANNNTWLVQIDKNVKELEDVVIGAALGSAVACFLIGVAVVAIVLLLRIGG
jgi:hypothetical protein